MANVTPAVLRQNFPEFSNTTNYPDGLISFWITFAYKLLRPSRWFDCLDEGVQLFVAHNIVLEYQAQLAAQMGSVPGQATGAVSNKSVDKVSAGYDTSATSVEGAGNWNYTTYGQRFIWLARMFGAGPIQVGIGHGPGPNQGGSIAWAGPWPWLIPNMNL